MDLRFCEDLANKVAHGPVVDKGRPRKAQNEMPAELPRVGRIQLINPVRLQVQLKVLAALHASKSRSAWKYFCWVASRLNSHQRCKESGETK